MATREEWIDLALKFEGVPSYTYLFDIGDYQNSMMSLLGYRPLPVDLEKPLCSPWYKEGGLCIDDLLVAYNLQQVVDLVTCEIPGANWGVKSYEGTAKASLSPNFRTPFIDCEAASPPLALCAVFCRVMAEKAGA